MTVRHREQDLRVQKIGTHVSPIGPTTFFVSALDGYWRICDDEPGFYPLATDFQLRESYRFYPTLTCTGNGHSWTSCPVGYQPAPADPRDKFPALTALDRQNLAWEILAKTNPSVPHVSIPAAVGEMKDFPWHRTKQWGDNLLKDVANGYISWRWAVAPLVGTLLKLCKFVESVDQRTTWLMKLRDGRTLRRRVRLSQTAIQGTPQVNAYVNTGGCTLRGTFKTLYEQRSWGTAQWRLLPDAELPKLGFGPLVNTAERLSLGLTSHELLAAAWELCPWSWLADWFGNTGDLIAATNNSVGCTWSHVCFMRESWATTFCEMNPSLSDAFAIAGLKNQNYRLQMIRKERYICVPVIPVPIPRLPILTSGQWSILASLAAQKL